MAVRRKIVVTQKMDLGPDQIERLKKLGELIVYNDMPATPQQWLERCREADVICSGKFGLREKIYELRNVFISLPFVYVGWLDQEKLRGNNITVAYSPGCNRDAVAEWIIAMIINLIRKLPESINLGSHDRVETADNRPRPGLRGKKLCILGPGNIGSKVGRVAESLDMRVEYFRRGDDLIKKIGDAEIIVNTLSYNPTTKNLLDKKFFKMSRIPKNAFAVFIVYPLLLICQNIITHRRKRQDAGQQLYLDFA